ncbi:uncharacterized protein LOC134259726 [Saccostrea cucullata]|uniref:uncharacterized protein LOC134259726 n=1 Tax=Saccostrea cuccullata TaxID=36930 RepID=UPI002ED5D635
MPSFVSVLIFLQILGNCKCSDPEYCEQSQLTVKEVFSCPDSLEKWTQRAEIKKCEEIKSNCYRKLEYHCVTNEWQNRTLEVCAPKAKIPAGYCPEYNTLGGKVQEFYTSTCKACKTDYFSTVAYNFSECFKNTRSYSSQSEITNTGSIQERAKIMEALPIQIILTLLYSNIFEFFIF